VISSIALIVDYTAQIAAGIQGVALPNGTTAGVRSTFGAGQGVYADPLHPGQMIAPAPENPLEPFTHFSNLPDAPTIARVTQDGVVELAWTLPMQFFVPRGDLRTVRQTLLPFFDAYLAVFLPQWTLGGLCLASWISSVKVESDADWAWLAMDLHVEELLNYG
jgi:hypothetical protein